MPLKADREYNGHIENANLYYSTGGTLGLQLHLACDEGKIAHTLWVTEKTIPRVEETLLKLGVSKEELHNENALENIGEILSGREVSFTTKSEEYKGQQQIKVQWLNKPRKAGDVTPAKMAASLFAGKPIAANGGGNTVAKPKAQRPSDEWENKLGITDEDVPF